MYKSRDMGLWALGSQRAGGSPQIQTFKKYTHTLKEELDNNNKKKGIEKNV